MNCEKPSKTALQIIKSRNELLSEENEYFSCNEIKEFQKFICN